MRSERVDVVVVGAGAAGLAAARRLADAGLHVAVLEARDRLGGRILTVHDAAFPLPVELGAEFIHGEPEATLALVREAGLMRYDVAEEAWQRLRDGTLKKLEGFNEQMAPVMNRLKELGETDESFAAFLDRICAPAPGELADACRMARGFVEGFDAADPTDISSLALAEEQQGIGDMEQQSQSRLLGGYGAIVDWLAAELARAGVPIMLNHVVESVRWRRGEAELAIRAGGPVQTWHARAAVLTLPVGVLQMGNVTFEPTLPRIEQAVAQLGSGPVVKAVMRFAEPFWENESIGRRAAGQSLSDMCFLHDPDATFPTWWTTLPLRTATLTAWAGGPKAMTLTGRGEAQLIDTAIATLADLLRVSAADIQHRLRGAHVYDWPADPFARGAYSYVRVGGAVARHCLAEPVEQTLFFAGEATDTEGQASTVAGALASGDRAARQVLATLGK